MAFQAHKWQLCQACDIQMVSSLPPMLEWEWQCIPWSAASELLQLHHLHVCGLNQMGTEQYDQKSAIYSFLSPWKALHICDLFVTCQIHEIWSTRHQYK